MQIKRQKYNDDLALKGHNINSPGHRPGFMDKYKKRRNQYLKLKPHSAMRRIASLAHRSTQFLIEFMIAPFICDSNITSASTKVIGTGLVCNKILALNSHNF